MERVKKQEQSRFRVLALDPSLTKYGWSVIEDMDVIAGGCIKTESPGKKSRIRKGDSDVSRISLINNTLKDIIAQFDIIYIVAELPHGSQSAGAANALGMVKGSTQAISDFLNIGLEWYSEADAKKAILGVNSASKTEVESRINKLFKVPWTGVGYKDEAIADSLAVYYCAKQNSHVVKTFKKLKNG